MKNKARRLNPLNSMVACLFLFMGMIANASFVTFNDRDAFLNFVGQVNTDYMDGITFGGQYSAQRNGYQFSMHHYGCVDNKGCSIGVQNPFVYSGNDWVWTFEDGEFDFDFQLTAFGIDYVEPFNGSMAQVVLNGFDSGSNPGGSFFGIAATDGSTFSRVTYEKLTSYGGFDNLVYSTTANHSGNVEIAAPYGLFLLGLAIVGFVRKKQLS